MSGKGYSREAANARASLRAAESDASARAQWEATNGVDYPGSKQDGVDLNCNARPSAAEFLMCTHFEKKRENYHPVLNHSMHGKRTDFVTTAVEQFAAWPRPLQHSLEIGPCANPVRLAPGVVNEKHYVDWAASVAGCSKKPGYITPTYLDDLR